VKDDVVIAYCMLQATSDIMLTTGWPLSRQRELPRQFAALGMLSVTHIMPVLVLRSVVGVGMQHRIYSY